MFKALQLTKSEAGFAAAITDIEDSRLPAGDVLVKVEYPTLNGKDGLAITDKGPVVRNWPMVAGIDSVMAPLVRRQQAWGRLAQNLNPARLDAMVEEVPLARSAEKAAELMAGRIRGRVVIKI